MSRVTQRELFEGDVATAANFNATLSSWNGAAGSGDIGADNVREEGLDTRIFDIGSVKKIFAVTDRFTGGNLSTNGFTTTSAVYVPVNIGGNARIGPFNASATYSRLVVHASFLVRTAVANEAIFVELARSTDGVTFSSIPATERVFQGTLGNTPYSQAALEQSCTISTRIFGVSATTYVMLRARSAGGGNISINCVSLFGELFRK
jgi:hypothetical protein